MVDMENVVKAIDICLGHGKCNDCPYCLSGKGYTTMNCRDYMLRDALAILKEQEWIPVTERLPKSMVNKVLVYVQHEDYVGYIGYGHYEKYKDIEGWFDLEHLGERFSDRGYYVTHWMETPIPPMKGR